MKFIILIFCIAFVNGCKSNKVLFPDGHLLHVSPNLAEVNPSLEWPKEYCDEKI